MLIELDLASDSPLYAQIVAGIRRALTTGELEPGQRLPPGRELAGALDVNLDTVQRAYRVAVDEGLLVSRVGRGTRVADEVDLGKIDLGSRIDDLVEFASTIGVGPDLLAQMLLDRSP